MRTSRKFVVEAEVCGTCRHYHQHYVLMPSGKFSSLWYGHCSVASVKNRNPDETCPHWKQEEKEEPVSES